MRKILVIGGSGTMGKPIVKLLLGKGDDVTVVCRQEVNNNTKAKYLYGNAKDVLFMDMVLGVFYDAIIDFCWYTSDEFLQFRNKLLNSTKQYICLSSAAVYAEGKIPLAENDPRFLETDPPWNNTFSEYHYEKARIEDILRNSSFSNWTIIRPHITYRENIPLGEFDNEEWLLRTILGKQIIIPRDMEKCITVITYAEDVVVMIESLIGCKKAFGETFNVASPNTMTWGELTSILDEITASFGYTMRIKRIPNSTPLIKAYPFLKYRYLCDRLIDRSLDVSKIENLIGRKFEFSDNSEKMYYSLKEYIEKHSHKKAIKISNWYSYAMLDRMSNEWTSLHYFDSNAARLRYVAARFYLLPILHVFKKVLVFIKLK